MEPDYDSADPATQAAIRSAWSRSIAETIETLDFAAEFKAMGSPYSEADARGRVVTHSPPS